MEYMGYMGGYMGLYGVRAIWGLQGYVGLHRVAWGSWKRKQNAGLLQCSHNGLREGWPMGVPRLNPEPETQLP